MLSWHIVSAATYYAADSYDSEKLYFLSDTGEIYKGNVPFSESIVMIDDLTEGKQAFETQLAAIANPARRKLYVSKKTLAAKTYDGTAWQQVIYPVVTGATGDTFDKTNATRPVSGKAVADYVAEVIGDADDFFSAVDYNSTTKVLTFTGGDSDANTATLEGLGCTLAIAEVSGHPEQGRIQLKDVGGNVLSYIDIDLERFVKSGEYNSSTRMITLYFDDEKTDYITIDASDLVSIISATDTDSIDLTAVNGQGATTLSADVKLASGTGYADNTLQIVSGKGLYVAPTDLSGKADKVTSATNGDLAGLDANGNLTDSGKAAGGAALASTPDANTLATEAAVDAIRTALTTLINGKASKISGGTVGNIVAVAADGELADSGKAAGGATLASTPDANTLATEAAVAAGDAAKANKLASGATAGDIVVVNSTDQTQIQTSGKAIGGATLAANPDADTVATEAAVAAAVSGVADNKIDKVAAATAGDLATFVSGGNVADSGKTIGGATFAATPDANTVATEAAAKAYSDSLIVTSMSSASTDATAPSAKAVYDALCWSTTM